MTKRRVLLGSIFFLFSACASPKPLQPLQVTRATSTALEKQENVEVAISSLLEQIKIHELLLIKKQAKGESCMTNSQCEKIFEGFVIPMGFSVTVLASQSKQVKYVNSVPVIFVTINVSMLVNHIPSQTMKRGELILNIEVRLPQKQPAFST